MVMRKKNRVERVSEVLRTLPVRSDLIQTALAKFCETGELPGHARPALDRVLDSAPGTRERAVGHDRGDLGMARGEHQPHRGAQRLAQHSDARRAPGPAPDPRERRLGIRQLVVAERGRLAVARPRGAEVHGQHPVSGAGEELRVAPRARVLAAVAVKDDHVRGAERVEFVIKPAGEDLWELAPVKTCAVRRHRHNGVAAAEPVPLRRFDRREDVEEP